MDPDHPEQCLLRIGILKSGKDYPGKSISGTAITEVSVNSFVAIFCMDEAFVFQTLFRFPFVERS